MYRSTQSAFMKARRTPLANAKDSVWSLRVIHKINGQLFDRTEQYRISAFHQDQSGSPSYFWEGVLGKDPNVLMTGHLWQNAGVWMYEEHMAFRDGQPGKLATRQRDLLRCSLLTQHRLISAMADLNPLLFLEVLLLTACTAATSPSLYRVTELVPGISTQDDAIAKLGPPSSSSNVGNSTILQWGGNNSPVHLAISFGMDGRMNSSSD